MDDCYIGLMSGTSMDGIDAVAATFADHSVQLLGTLHQPYPAALRDELLAAIDIEIGVSRIGRLDRRIGECFRDAAASVIRQSGVLAADIAAIGSHGQTIRHEPNAPHPYSLQIGDAATIALGTGIRTVADFRRADIAAGGQGAPLVPPFHRWLFADPDTDRVVVNIGGIANVTILRADGSPVTGFDTGPGNTLLDRWIRQNKGHSYDRDGAWAASGTVDKALLERCLAFDYFSAAPPKSTGFEQFNLDWLAGRDIGGCEPANVQATLCELTARTIANDIARHAPRTSEVYVCGGGAHNSELMRRLADRLPGSVLDTTAVAGLHPDWVEATAFAWLAMRTVHNQTGNLPSVTGATRKVVLGAIHSA
jgi:anhydro-N-acetylmuramic acid kinase